jgi:anaerobic magnesium-protoporphyrin IX monomethyl ester cyclase
MARVLLTTVYDQYAVGLRIMAACLLQAGHDVRLLFLETEKKLSREWRSGMTASPHKYMVIGNGGGIAVFDGTLSPITEASWALYAEEIRRFSPQIIGFGMRSYFDDQAAGFLRRVRGIRPNALLVCGGFGPTFNPRPYLEAADLVVRGEGEQVMVDVADALDDGGSFGHIASICFLADGHIRANPLRAPLRDLDSLPFPLYGGHTCLIQDGTVSNRDEGLTNYVTLAGRGCLGSCTYYADKN